MKILVVLSLTFICSAKDNSVIIISGNQFMNGIEFSLEFNVRDLPSNLDWRSKGVVLPVQDQGKCGQSEVINAMDAISAFAVLQANRSLVALSQQQIFDCSTNPHWCPCGASGNGSDIYDMILANHGSVDTAQSYPLSGKCDTKCHFKSEDVGATLVAYATNLNFISEQLLQELLQFGPVTAEVNASPQSFVSYNGSIYDDPKCTADQVSHSLLVVGYGSEDDHDFWIARNSWGTKWGENGYMRLSRNKGNLCGIATKIALPWAVK